MSHIYILSNGTNLLPTQRLRVKFNRMELIEKKNSQSK